MSEKIACFKNEQSKWKGKSLPKSTMTSTGTGYPAQSCPPPPPPFSYLNSSAQISKPFLSLAFPKWPGSTMPSSFQTHFFVSYFSSQNKYILGIFSNRNPSSFCIQASLYFCLTVILGHPWHSYCEWCTKTLLPKYSKKDEKGISSVVAVTLETFVFLKIKHTTHHIKMHLLLFV